jgi:hypothetical protein
MKGLIWAFSVFFAVSGVHAEDFDPTVHGFFGATPEQVRDMIGQAEVQYWSQKLDVVGNPVDNIVKMPKKQIDFSDEWRGFVQDGHYEFSWKRLLSGSERIVYLGEAHHIKAIKSELSSNFKEIHDAGITHLALEMVAERHQKALNKGSNAEILKILKTEWGHAPQAYVDMIRAARAAGIKVVAMDRHLEQQKSDFKSCRAGGGSSGECKGEVFYARDVQMFKTMGGVLSSDGKSRILALVGSDHIELSGQHQRASEATGVDVSAYIFTWGNGYIDSMASDAGLNEKRVFLPIVSDAVDHDGWIRLPKILKEGLDGYIYSQK